MSSAENKTFPTIGLNVSSGRNHIATKAKAAWKYIYEHHLSDAEYFVKADPDTYMIVGNLKKYLENYDADALEFFGHRFKVKWHGKMLTYNSGGPGQVLSRGAVRKLVEEAFTMDEDCMPDGIGSIY